MIQIEKLREKEAEAGVIDGYEKAIRQAKERVLRAKSGKKIVKAKEKPFRIVRQGIIRQYTARDVEELCNQNWTIFCHEIRQHSGRHRHQGGYHLFVIGGRGYSLVDGVRFDWKAGDLILLPFKKAGVEHQHFNLEEKPSRWVAFHHLPTMDNIGSVMEQKENFSLWKEK